MAVTWNPASEVLPSQFRIADATNYSTVKGLLDLGLIDKPAISDALVKTYGDQDLTGFTRAVGNMVGVGADKKEWFEETRLHAKGSPSFDQATSVGGTETIVATFPGTPDDNPYRLYDVLTDGLSIAYVTAIDYVTGAMTLEPYTTWKKINSIGPVELTIVGNDYKEGSDQPTNWIESNVKHRESPFMIIKDQYTIPGSQMTNIAWVYIPAGKQNGGGWVWYLKGENDQRMRFENYAERTMIEAEVATNANVTSEGVTGTEGLFSAIRDRGITGDAAITDFTDVQTLAQEFENERGADEYTMWCTIDQTQDLDDMLATTTGSLANTSYGLFDNDKDMAVTLGFSGFRVSGYDFYYKKWKLANDPTMLGAHMTDFNTVLIPADTIMDARSGEHIPSFSIAYREAEGYSREIEVFLLGSANIPLATNGLDVRQINYRTERGMCVAAANRYALT